MENPITRAGIYFDSGQVQVDQRWDSVPRRPLTMEEAFDSIENSGAWMIFRRVHLDPDYNDILEECLRDVKALSGRRIEEDRKSQEAMIFVTSPNRITSYHIDRECNFLMQVRGTKTIHIFNRDDREVTPEQELETFWSRDNNAGIYKQQYEDRAHVFAMQPGDGVHIPVNSPHWLQNGNNISISLSISYQQKDSNRKYVYQANYYLRKFGLHPTPPGQHAMLDRGKSLAMAGGLRVKKLLARQPH
ncbi:cupin domain-containing protein [Silvibacterium dinghuense]|uniref:Transcriptional regulator n=1 Tax=Silvibacterium dinghuense TaxID=1560006 RepID=A0A4V1NVQ5_9BACT|nr:cupin domain-containing protein [Silvibacterium dinghuense]RXS96742.1 transcriptional regulator [Silvibacterium dinghuense]